MASEARNLVWRTLAIVSTRDNFLLSGVERIMVHWIEALGIRALGLVFVQRAHMEMEDKI